MSFARLYQPVADRVDVDPDQRRAVDGPRITAPRDAHQLLMLQRLAGNRAASSLVAVQRCGPIPSDECPCQDEGGSSPSPQPARSGDDSESAGPSAEG